MKIQVNNKEYEVPGETITRKELLFVAGFSGDRTVTYKQTKDGELKEGERMVLTGKVVFTVKNKSDE